MGVELGSAVGKIEIDASGVAKGLADAQRGLAGAKSGLAAIGPAATRAGTGLLTLGAPLVAFGAIAAKTAGDFESQMNVLAVAARGSGTSLEDLRKVALQAGADVTLVGVSASEVAEAMTGFQKAGLSVNDTLGNMQGYLAGTVPLGGALRAAIDLAAASELDLAQASDLVTITMSTFGLSADEVVGKIGNYVQAADASVASVADLAAAMTNAGPTMAAFGFSLEDVNTALAILSTRGIAGAEGGTALKSMMTNMMRTTDDVVGTLADLNVELYNVDGTMRELPDIIADLSKGMAGLTEEQRNQAVQTLAGSYGMKAMNTLLAEGTAGWKSMETAIDGATTMQDSAAARTKGFNAAMENLSSNLETFLITVGTPLINDVLVPLVGILTDLFGKLATVNPEFLKWVVVIGGVLAGLGTLLVVVGQVAGAISSIGALVGLLAPILGPAIAGIVAALAPIALPILAVIAVVALLYLAWKNNWLGIRDWVQKIVPEIGAFLASAWEWIKATAINVWTAISTFFTTTWTAIQTTATTIWTAVSGFFTTITTAIQTTINTIWTAISTFFTTITTAIQTTITTSWTIIRDTVHEIWTKMLEKASEIWVGIRDTITDIVNGLISFAGNAGGAMIEAFRNSIVSKANAVLDAVRTIVAKIRALLPGSDAKVGPLSDLTAAGRALPVTLAKGIVAGQGAVYRAAMDMLPDLANPLAGFGGRNGPVPAFPTAPAAGSTTGPSMRGQGSIGGSQSIAITINNPTGEPAESSIMRQLRNLASIGVLDPVSA